LDYFELVILCHSHSDIKNEFGCPCFCSILGGMLLVGGLYSVLWGKSNENENKITPVVPKERENQEERTVQEKHEEDELTSHV
jgi:hypothetical protein